MRKEERNIYIEKCLTLMKLALKYESNIPEDLINRLSGALESLNKNQEIKVLIETEDNDWTGFEDYKYLYENTEKSKNNKKKIKDAKNYKEEIITSKVIFTDDEPNEHNLKINNNNKFTINHEVLTEMMREHIMTNLDDSQKRMLDNIIYCCEDHHSNKNNKDYIDIDPESEYIVETSLKELLARKGLSQVDVARQINVSVKTLNNIVAQKANTSIEVALKLSHILQEPIENIFSLNGKVELVEDK